MDEQFDTSQHRGLLAPGTISRDGSWFYAVTAAGEPIGRFRTAAAARSVLASGGWDDEPRLTPGAFARLAVAATVGMGGALTLLVTNAVVLG